MHIIQQVAFAGYMLVVLPVIGIPTQVQAQSLACPRGAYTGPVYCLNQTPNASSNPNRSYGAIAYSSNTGQYGTSHNYSNRAEAEGWAMRECGKDDCKIGAWFRNRCGAVAVGDNDVFGGESHDSTRGAQELALIRCAKEGGRNCKVVKSQCSL